MIWEAHFQIFMATLVQMMIIFYTFTCRSQMSWCFKRMFCLHLQGDWTASSGQTRLFTIFRWMNQSTLPELSQYVPPEYQNIQSVHGVRTQQTTRIVNYLFTAWSSTWILK